jgi:Tfp pilus assembly protein PilZ
MANNPAQPPTGSERRKHQRVHSQLIVKVHRRTDTKGRWHMCPVKDIGLGGIRTSSTVAMQEGVELELQLLLPTEPAPVPLMGRVTWATTGRDTRTTEFGIQFTEMTPPQQKTVGALVQIYSERQHPTT